ncbi:Fic/DOC family protein [Bacillus mesophilum]|uniref:protein adenylyltransferase n=1 Tax=Bacillus mesophilum TaxID=1071718 RepID=A0A7V7RHX1_9BACI|nr:Fic family protein [Bacillus mesophilum]KAB2329422.1 cell filamentation protein Fic [Bacillus mesophilum]
MGEYQSKYCYPGTEILKNKFNVKDQQVLDTLDAGLTAKRLLDLQKNPIKGSFDMQHLKKIHAYIFQDLYSFAGEIRTENISKGFPFADVNYLQPAADVIFNQLKKEKHLAGLDYKSFSERAAYYMAEINVLHPFREGNGRSQREFIRTLACRNGYNLDWSKVDKNKALETFIRSKVDHHPLADLIENCLESRQPNLALKKNFLSPQERGMDR